MKESKRAQIVLAGNPNVGKSTIFNCLTGMRQHTGNWAGKTVASAEGVWKEKASPDPRAMMKDIGIRQELPVEIKLIDVPGCYSLVASSPEEEVARDKICDPDIDGIIVVCDGTCLERNLILVLQILAHRDDVIVCVNLMDQVRRRGLSIDDKKLSGLLGVPVICTQSSQRKELRKDLAKVCRGFCRKSSKYRKCSGYCHELMEDPKETADKARYIADEVMIRDGETDDISVRIDRIMTNSLTAFPIMALMVMMLFWITIQGANYPSDLLGKLLFSLEEPFHKLLMETGLPLSVCEMLSSGMYRVLAWVVSVMLPPMAIFFPLFTLMEDWGILPRIAFDLDRCFKCCKACGKQALTMCMGLGCNASAVVGCRIIDSERERILAIVTNSLIPCNGRFPVLLAVISMFFASGSGWKGAIILTGVVLLGVAVTFIASKILTLTLLRGRPSSFTLELPPYRKPQIGRVIVRSMLDRTIFVLARAAAVAAPAGIIIWIMANIEAGDMSLIDHMTSFLEPVGKLMGLDGVILTAFILGLPANEIVMPIIMMVYMSRGTLGEITDLSFFCSLLTENGWTMLTAVNMLIFSLMHWPCATTILSVRKETGSWKWTAVSILVPFLSGMILCTATAFIYRFFL